MLKKVTWLVLLTFIFALVLTGSPELNQEVKAATLSYEAESAMLSGGASVSSNSSASNGVWAPNLDRITIDTGSQVGNIFTLTNGNVKVEYDLSTGTSNFYYNGVKKMSNFYAGVQLSTYVTSKMYLSRTYSTIGDTTIVTCTGNGYPTMKQSFTLNGGNKFLTRVIMEGTNLSTNWIAPVVMDTQGGVDIGSYGDNKILRVPYDNDKWVRYNAIPLNNSSGTGFEAAAIYDNLTRNGIVVGSVTHDTWKTGIYYNGANNKLNNLNIFGGASDSTWTHDVMSHGKVSGNTLYSPIIFVGYSSDWRNLMEEYADANTYYDSKLSWSGGVPFGWNSWGKIQSTLNYNKAITVSDFVKNNLQNNNFNNNGAVYVNLDSYWDNLSETELSNFVSHCHTNRQKAGIYWAPFIWWGTDLKVTVEGSSYKYGDIVLKKTDGSPISLDGALALDPTHPGTKERINYFIDKFKTKGFEYIKLDFLTHGALEGGSINGNHYDSSVQTGTQAYNQGMQYIVNRIGGQMFISLSIAPLFPYKYGNARRLACDTYGSASESSYMLNSLTYGWWMNGNIYQYNDPDQLVFDGFSANENKTRLISGVISGTVFLAGDDLTTTTGQDLAKTYLTNSRIDSVARLGKTFRPVEGNTSSDATDVFMLQNGTTNYIAVFNYGSTSTTKSVNLLRAGLNGTQNYSIIDLWSGSTSSASGTLSVSLGGYEAKLFELK